MKVLNYKFSLLFIINNLFYFIMKIDIPIKVLFYLTVGSLYIFNEHFGKKFYTIVGVVYILFFMYLFANRTK